MENTLNEQRIQIGHTETENKNKLSSPEEQDIALKNAIRAGTLPEKFYGNLYFSVRIHRELDKQIPISENRTVFYIGSGGDFISAWLSTGADIIYLMDKTPFLIKSTGDVNRNINLKYQTFDEVWEEATHLTNRINTGTLTVHENVRPALQLAISLQQLGIKKDNVSCSLENEGQATIAVRLEDIGIPSIVLIKYSEGEITDYHQIADKLNNNETFGLMTKGGTGTITTDLFGTFPTDQIPKFIITDDLHSNDLKKLSNLTQTNVTNNGLFPISWGWQDASLQKGYYDIVHIFTNGSKIRPISD